MPNLRSWIPALFLAAAVAGCAPAGMAPPLPSVVRDGVLTLDAKHGTGRAIARVTVKDAAKRTLLAVVDQNVEAVIDHVDLALHEWDAENESVGSELSTGTIAASQLATATITFTGLRAYRGYIVIAKAYKDVAGQMVEISDPDYSSRTFDVEDDNRPTVQTIPVQLKDVTFDGRATSGGLDISEGSFTTPIGPFIVPGAEVDPAVDDVLAGVIGANDRINDANPLAAKFNSPSILTTVGTDVYVADSVNREIRRIAGNGAVSTVAGRYDQPGSFTNGNLGVSTFNDIRGLTADGDGNLYVSDAAIGPGFMYIRKIAPNGEVTTFAGGDNDSHTDGALLSAHFRFTLGLAFDRDHAIYVADGYGHTIRKIDLDAGMVSTIAGVPGVAHNSGGALDGVGYPDATGTKAQFHFPTALAVELDGSLLVVDTDAHAIRRIKFLQGGTHQITTIAGDYNVQGDDDGVGTAARFRNPNHIAVDGLGNAYVSEGGQHRIRKLVFDGNGVPTVSTFAGGNGSGYADSDPGPQQLNGPSGMAFRSDGRMLVAESGNHIIRRFGWIPAGSQ